GCDRARGPARRRRGGDRRSDTGLRADRGGGGMTVAPLQDLVAEARRILDAAAEVPLRVLGGAAVALAAGGETRLPRSHNDIDFVTTAGRGPAVLRAFAELGYAGDQRFSGLNGHRRLLFCADRNDRRADALAGR